MISRALRSPAAALLLLALAVPCAAAPLRICGRVLTAGGAVAGLTVEALPAFGPGEREAQARALTGADGFFTLALPESGCFQVRAAAEGSTGPEALVVLVEDVDLPPLVLPLRNAEGMWRLMESPKPAPPGEPRAVAGRVTATVGAPLAGALVWSDQSPWTAPVRTDGEGRFRISLPPVKDLTLRAAAAGHFPSTPVPTTASPVAFELRPAAAVTGQVVDGQGRPVPGVPVSADSVSRPSGGTPTWTRPDGRFRLSPLEPGETYRLTAEAEGFAPASALADAGPRSAPVRIVLGQGGTVAGRLMDERSRRWRAPASP